MASGPTFPSLPTMTAVTISTANTARDGTGTMGTLITGGPNGTVLEGLRIKATGVTTTGMIRIFHYDGTTVRLFDEVAVTAATPSSTVQSFKVSMPFPNKFALPRNHELRCSTEKAEEFEIFAFDARDF